MVDGGEREGDGRKEERVGPDVRGRGVRGQGRIKGSSWTGVAIDVDMYAHAAPRECGCFWLRNLSDGAEPKRLD